MTPLAQVLGALLILTPAVVHPIALAGAARTSAQIAAVVTGFAGAMVVFSGLATRAYPASDPVRRPRTVWSAGLAGAILLGAGAVVCGWLAVPDRGPEYLAAAVMFGLPAVALGVVLWRGRGVWAGPAAARHI